MSKKRLLLVFCVALISIVATADGDFKTEFKLFERTCRACHECSWFLQPRSFKAWQLTVERMRSFAAGSEQFEFTKEDSERITKFLADHVGSGVLLTSAGQEVIPGETNVDALDVAAAAVATSAVVEVAGVVSEPAAPEPTPEPMVQVAPHVVVPASIAARAKRFWNPSPAYLALARVTGFFSVAFLVGLFGSGLGRRKLKLRFRQVHVAMALGLFLSLTVHGIIYICKYGTPSVLWYWFGLIGFIALIVTQVQGIVRKHFRRGLLVAHIAGACVGLALSILHWIWAWL